METEMKLSQTRSKGNRRDMYKTLAYNHIDTRHFVGGGFTLVMESPDKKKFEVEISQHELKNMLFTMVGFEVLEKITPEEKAVWIRLTDKVLSRGRIPYDKQTANLQASMDTIKESRIKKGLA